MKTLKRRYRGALVGLAVGDALGEQVEGRRRGTFDPPDRMTGGGFSSLPPGAWTDDTATALCLAESILESGGFDLDDQMKRFVLWRTRGHLSSTGHCVGIGATTYERIADYMLTGCVTSSSQNPATEAGNGSIMRLAPVPMAFGRRTDLAKLCARSSCTTHNMPICADACSLLGVMIGAALYGASKSEILDLSHVALGELDSAIEAVRRGSYRFKDAVSIESSGYVVHTLEAALWAFFAADDFASGLRLAIALGGDTDTVGAVYGQLAGAHYGEDAIPDEWRLAIRHRPRIVSFADGLLRFSLRRAV